MCKTKIKSYVVKINTNVHDDNGVPKEGSPCICLSVILMEKYKWAKICALRKYKNV